VSLKDGSWAVIDSDGRFDANDLEEIKGLHWIMPDDPLRALPLEIFMRDYYEPRLLPRALAGEQFSAMPVPTKLNRAQPKVEITDIRTEDEPAGRVALTVEVSSGQFMIAGEDKSEALQSGAYNLRVFREGQLVAQFPEHGEAVSSSEQTREQELAHWRQQNEIHLDPKTGKKTITFHGIRLPRKVGLKEAEFSAYAFNIDRVKGGTARKRLDILKSLTPRSGRAYVVAIGVNGFERDAMSRLSYAANDARSVSGELSKRLVAVTDPQTGMPFFGESNVVPLTLTTEFGGGNEADRLITNQATKDRIKAVLDTLAGKPVDPAQLKGIANAESQKTLW
jgi:hypothetical protein